MADRERAYEASPAAETTTLKLVSDPELRKLLDYWRSKRQGNLMPSKDDIDPLEIGWALSRIFLTDYRPEDGFTYRLAGADISGVFGRGNLKGLNLREVVKPERLEAIEKAWMQVVEKRAVVCMKGMVYLGVDRTAIGERLLLPLAGQPEGPVTGLLGMTVCEWVPSDVPRQVKLSRADYVAVSDIP